MPLYEIEIPGQGKYQVESPTELTDVQAYAAAAAQANAPASTGRKPEDVGFIEGAASALKKGVTSYGDIGTGYGVAGASITGNKEELAKKMAAAKAAKQVPEETPGMTYADLERIYEEKGLGAALKQVPSFITESTLRSAPQMAAPLAAGAAATPFLSPVGGALVGIGTYGLQQFGNFMLRQAEERNNPEEVSALKAAITAGVTAPLGYFADRFTAGMGGLGKNAGEQVLKELAFRKAAIETGKRVGKGATAGVIAEAPLEVLEQAAERLQAGLDLTGKDAVKEYKEAFFGAAGTGAVVGGGSRGYQAAKELMPAKPEAPPTEETKGPSGVVVDENGQIIDKEVFAKREAAKAAQTSQETETTAGAPLTGQGDLFTQEEAPYQVTPDELTAQTQAGTALETPALQANERAQAEIERSIFALQQQEQTPEVQAQIADLQSQLQQGPGATLDTLKVEYETLERKKLALADIKQQLTEQRDATPSLDAKLPITQQLNAIEEQGAQIAARQQELLTEGKTAAKDLPTEEAVAEPELNVANTITEDDFKTMGIGRTNKKLREAILGKSLANPEEKQAIIDALTAYAQDKNRSASISTKVGEFIDGISKETTNVPRGDVSGAVPGGSKSGVRVPSISGVAPGATQTSIAGGVASPVGTAGGLDDGKGGVRKAGAAPLKTEPTKPAIDTSQLDDADRKSIEGFGPRQKRPSTNWFSKKTEEFKKARERGANRIEALFTKGQVYFSFDKAFSDRLYKHFMQLKAQGDLTIEQVKQAMLRISTSQALHRSNLATQIMERGGYKYDEITNRWEAVNDDVNMSVFEGIINKLATRLNVDETTAMQMMDAAYEANRLDSFYNDLTKSKTEATLAQKKIDALKRNKKRTKVEQKELDTKNALLDKLNKDIERLEGKVRHKTRAQVKEGMDLYNRHPEIQLGTKVWNTMRGRTLKMMVDTGMLTEEKAQQWMDEAAYVPFFRDLKEEKDTSTDAIINKGLKESMTPLRAHMEGSELEVTSPIGNMHKWMQWAIASSISNKQQQVMIDQYAAAIPDEVREGKGSDSNTFSIYRDGVQRFYHVADPIIAQAFSHMAPMVFPSIGAFRGASNILRHSVTRFPTFPIGQILMDSYAVMFTSGLKHPFRTLGEIGKEVYRTYKDTSATRELLIRQGILETNQYAALSEADAIGERLGFEKPGIIKRTARALDKFASLADNVVRQGVYNQAKNEKQSDVEAAERAAEIVNFRRTSGIQGVQYASQIIPFFNAWNQVLSVTLRTVSGKGIVPQERSAGLKTLTSTTAKIAGVSFLYAAMVGDDEDYDKKNKEVRDRLWMVPGTGMGIPIRMDLFALPKIAGEYTYNLIMDKGYVDSAHLKKAISKAIKGSITPPSEGVPQFIRPTMEVALNYDMFQDRNIINPTMKKLEADQQYTKSTAEWAKVLGKAINVAPVNLEHLLRGYTGSIATIVGMSTDWIIADMRGVPRAEKSWRETLARTPNIGVMLGKEENTAVLSDFYEVARDVNKVVDSYRDRAKYNSKEAREYINTPERRTLSNQYEGIKDISGALEKLKREENRVLNLPNRTEDNPNGMTGAEKAVRIKELNQIRERLVEPTYRMRKNANL